MNLQSVHYFSPRLLRKDKRVSYRPPGDISTIPNKIIYLSPVSVCKKDENDNDLIETPATSQKNLGYSFIKIKTYKLSIKACRFFFPFYLKGKNDNNRSHQAVDFVIPLGCSITSYKRIREKSLQHKLYYVSFWLSFQLPSRLLLFLSCLFRLLPLSSYILLSSSSLLTCVFI